MMKWLTTPTGNLRLIYLSIFNFSYRSRSKAGKSTARPKAVTCDCKKCTTLGHISAPCKKRELLARLEAKLIDDRDKIRLKMEEEEEDDDITGGGEEIEEEVSEDDDVEEGASGNAETIGKKRGGRPKLMSRKEAALVQPHKKQKVAKKTTTTTAPLKLKISRTEKNSPLRKLNALGTKTSDGEKEKANRKSVIVVSSPKVDLIFSPTNDSISQEETAALLKELASSDSEEEEEEDPAHAKLVNSPVIPISPLSMTPYSRKKPNKKGKGARGRGAKRR
jgi:hypothetical protein